MKIITKICPVCNEQYTKEYRTQRRCKDCKQLKRCEKHEIVHKSALRCEKCIIDDSRIRYNDDNSYEWIECTLCGYRGGDLFSHINYFHKMSVDEFKVQSGLTSIKSQKMRDGIKGDKNPAYQHDGKYSPFSEKFIYSDTIDAKGLHKKAEESRIKNDSHAMKLSYWVKKTNGDVEQAKILHQEKLDTLVFSLDRCIEKHGFEKGYEIWKKRQEKWLNTLNSKSQEEIDDINRKKATKLNYNTLWKNAIDSDGIFYILKLQNGFVKIGITSLASVDLRYKKVNVSKYEIIETFNSTINHCFQIEQLLVRKFKNHKISKQETIDGFGWTETFKNISVDKITEELNNYKNPIIVEEEFNNTIKSLKWQMKKKLLNHLN